MRRGEVWTVADDGGDYAGKPGSCVIVQDDKFGDTASVTVCPLTTDPTDAPLFRVPIDPTGENGLDSTSRLMVDKITTVRRIRIGERAGRLDHGDMVRLDRAILGFMGLA